MVEIMTAGGFNEIPADERAPGFLAEVDGSQAGTFVQNVQALLIAQKLPGGSAPSGAVVLVPGSDGVVADDLFGAGSQAALMVRAFRQTNAVTTLYAIALDDDASAVAATGAMTINGPATKAGTLALYIGEARIRVAVAAGSTGAEIAAALASAINAAAGLPVTAEADENVLKVTARNAGECGNDIRVSTGCQGEDLPEGLTVKAIYLSGGTGNPDVVEALAAIGDTAYDFWVFPWTDTANLNAVSGELDRQWAPYQMLYPVAFSARRGTVSQLASVFKPRNDRFLSIIEAVEGEVSPAFLKAARYGGAAAKALANHGARPLHTLALTGHLPATPTVRPTRLDRNTLLKSGCATSVTVSGVVQIDRAITLYQRNALGTPDNAFYDITTPASLRFIIRRLKQRCEADFIVRRCLLVDDNTPIADGVPYATPATVRAVLIDEYQRLMLLGYAEREAQFEARLIVSRDPDDPTRLNVKYTPDLANPLIVFATQVAFALQWPDDLVA